MLHRTSRFAGILVPLIVLAGVATSATASAAAAAGHPQVSADAYVSPKGTDAGSCSKAAPCATINYALSVAPSGGTVLVEPGDYHQTVSITKPITLLGSGAGSTTINGSGIDPGGSDYGVVYVGAAGGAVTVSHFTIVNPYPFAYTGGEPEAVALADPNGADAITISHNIVREGSADAQAGTDFPIGIDTFKNAASTTISDNTISGFFQGALLEDNGPAKVQDNTFRDLIANTYQGTSYPAEGLFFLSDLAGSITSQNASKNTFTKYAGYGIAASAGYDGGNCTTPCPGSLSGALTDNSFNIDGAPGSAAISLSSQYSNDTLTMKVERNQGTVSRPDDSIDASSSNGATLSVSQQGNNIRVMPASSSHHHGTGAATAHRSSTVSASPKARIYSPHRADAAG